MKLGINIYHLNGHCYRAFKGHRSKVKVLASWSGHDFVPINTWRKHTFLRCGIEAQLLYFCPCSDPTSYDITRKSCFTA